MEDPGTGIRYPWQDAPKDGQATHIADGILWLRLPLPMALDHINIYALDEGNSWTIVDTGLCTKRSAALWQQLLAGPLLGRPVSRVILTHYHPDHVGMAGWFMDRFGAELITTRTSWLLARMLILDEETEPTPQAIDYWRAGGVPADILQTRMQTRSYNFADTCHSLPIGYTRLQQGDVIRAGGRDWDVHIGHGHAPEHLTLWSRDDNLVLAGDQILPAISPNIGVYPTEPMADPLSEWLESCDRLTPLARPGHLVLGGHNRPFTGLPFRMQQLAENHHNALARLKDHLQTPRTACDCFSVLFKRTIDSGSFGLALAESVAHLNHLWHRKDITRTRRADGAWLWSIAD